jgi:hypothetical protein
MRRPRIGVAKRLVNPKLAFQIKERTIGKISQRKKVLALRACEKAKYPSGSSHRASSHVRHFQNLRILSR